MRRVGPGPQPPQTGGGGRGARLTSEDSSRVGWHFFWTCWGVNERTNVKDARHAHTDTQAHRHKHFFDRILLPCLAFFHFGFWFVLFFDFGDDSQSDIKCAASVVCACGGGQVLVWPAALYGCGAGRGRGVGIRRLILMVMTPLPADACS